MKIERKIAWLSDIHWDRKDDNERILHIETIQETDPDVVILSGDIGEAPSFSDFLAYLQDQLALPIYFVLGNHDFWHGSFNQVRLKASQLANDCSNLHYLSALDVVPLSETTCLIGDDGWGDGRAGNPDEAPEFPRDFSFIKDLAGLSRTQCFERINALGGETAGHVHDKLLRALRSYCHIYLVTHVPPFPEACLDSFRICHEHKLPFYCCSALGSAIVSVMDDFPEHTLTVLCGHTHHECDVSIRNNLQIRVKEASYAGCHSPTLLQI